MNLALDFLPGAFAFDPSVGPAPDAELASSIVWFDAYVTNVDRTVRNTNILVWHKRLWLIDNGASLYFHFAGPDYVARASSPFLEIRSHVLLRPASALHEVDGVLSARPAPNVIQSIVSLIPDAWLDDPAFFSPEERRAAYSSYLSARLRPPRAFVEEAIDARAQLL